ncbi:MAG: acyl-CoA dehydrogenase [Pseudomonadales bacterium]|nr:acyl-CoA/acyl-ACP dehydrogenase [Pseudomonadales bacterium]NIX08180.1 acyl-CoA dehydrogenase [Pseudomonadales bacterium]
MSFSFTDEQEQFREATRRFLQDKSPTTEVRRLMETSEGYDPAVWDQLSRDLALPGIHVPESFGGAGFGAVELGIVMEELGKSLVCAPYLGSSVLAATAILEAGTESWKSELLPQICAGRQLGALAVTEIGGRWDSGGIEAIARESDAGFALTGAKSFVVDGLNADVLIVAARAPDTVGDAGVGLFVVRPADSGVSRTALETIDPTRKLARIDLRDAPALPLGEPGADWPALERTLDLAAVALANESVGGAQVMLDTAVEYSKIRMQFGRAIGSFQAIKHRCADMLVEVELAKSAAYYAAQAAASGDSELPALACLAKAATSDAFVSTATSCIQIHGGIGFTWDHDTHLWFKRAKSSEVFLGSPDYHRELYLQRCDV